jgi:hypothetical protein
VDDDVGVRKAGAQRLLDPVRRCVPLAHGRTGRDPDNDVCEVRAARLADAKTSKLHRRVERLDRPSSRLLSILGHAVHEHVDIAPEQPRSRNDDERCHEERGDGIALVEARRGGDEPGEHGQRAGEHAHRQRSVAQHPRVGLHGSDATWAFVATNPPVGGHTSTWRGRGSSPPGVFRRRLGPGLLAAMTITSGDGRTTLPRRRLLALAAGTTAGVAATLVARPAGAALLVDTASAR